MAIISDTVDDTNGVAIGLRRLVAASRAAGHRALLVGPLADVADDVVRFPTAMSSALPFYPSMTWSVPELPALLEWLAASADLVQVSTPGPMGIAGLIAARMLKLPVVAQYHTEVAEYAARMTGLPMLRALIEPLVGWFYQQADVCLSPSAAVSARLAAIGVAADKQRRIPRGVDLDLFTPARRDRAALERCGVSAARVVIYVGRLSREKNLEVLATAWQTVRAARADVELLVVGDGPHDVLAGPGIVACGPRFDAELASLIASADVFAFPSETETFGNVVVEAGASGVPVVVSSAGAAHEHVVDGETGIVLSPCDSSSMATSLLELLDDEPRRHRLGRAARRHVGRYDLDGAVASTWAIYREVYQRRHSMLEAVAS